ncbi:MAG: winged helix-turn-helix transcriptional regulator [Candidatus Accumulibacter necessarius]
MAHADGRATRGGAQRGGAQGLHQRRADPDQRVFPPVETLAKTPEKILAALKARPDLTLAELASSIGKSLSAVERATAKLVKEERLRFVGPKKGGHWEVLE